MDFVLENRSLCHISNVIMWNLLYMNEDTFEIIEKMFHKTWTIRLNVLNMLTFVTINVSAFRNINYIFILIAI